MNPAGIVLLVAFAAALLAWKILQEPEPKRLYQRNPNSGELVIFQTTPCVSSGADKVATPERTQEGLVPYDGIEAYCPCCGFNVDPIENRTGLVWQGGTKWSKTGHSLYPEYAMYRREEFRKKS